MTKVEGAVPVNDSGENKPSFSEKDSVAPPTPTPRPTQALNKSFNRKLVIPKFIPSETQAGKSNLSRFCIIWSRSSIYALNIALTHPRVQNIFYPRSDCIHS
jgi:hypothetical protein